MSAALSRRPIWLLLLCGVLITALSACPNERKRQEKERRFRAHYDLGLNCLNNQRYECAVSELKKAEAIRPDDPDALFALGVAYFSTHELATAEEYLRHALTERSSFVQARNYLGLVYMERRLWDKAIEQFDIALADDTNFEPWIHLTNKGICLYESGNNLDAIRALNSAVERNDRFCLAQHHLGVVHSRLDNSPKALGYFHGALELCPNFQNGYIAMGKEYNKTGDRWRACEAFNKAFELAPNTETGRKALEFATALKCR